MKEIKKVLIIGTGLIGSSIALCIKEEYKDITLLGYSASESELIGAKSRGIIDDYSLNLKELSEESDVIFFCTPVLVTIELMKQVSQYHLKPNVILTDACSTKKEILKSSTVFSKKNRSFVGGHPMAGSHKSGFLAADKDLFENAYYILVSDDSKKSDEIKQLKSLLKGTHAKFIELSSTEHDKMTGVLSHMPHVIAAQLVERANELIQVLPQSKQLAAGGFRDITRIASSDPKMWADISITNNEFLVDEINHWIEDLGQLKKELVQSNEPALIDFFDRAKKVRDDIPVHKEGTIPAFHDLYVNVPDYPGAIAEVTSVLAQNSISLINIKIMETRDDIFGILCISFKNEKDLEKARLAISKETTYHCINN